MKQDLKSGFSFRNPGIRENLFSSQNMLGLAARAWGSNMHHALNSAQNEYEEQGY